MSEKVGFNKILIDIGEMLENKRKALGKKYSSRVDFIDRRSMEIFDGKPWISERHLANLERGKNWISVEMLIQHAYALETDPVDLFATLLEIYEKRN